MLPITHAEIWKTMGIDRRACSIIIADMLNKSLIKRTRSSNTFLLESKNGRRKPKYPPILSTHGKFSPCCGCVEDCKPYQCDLLIGWLKQ